ncbi:DUF63 family protein [Natrononativus amylolyticus]|uniref:DUF63 family protein n=1 Tax=Natrononativus amylolyticus TaxID=2963434 RepID=UPI0020CCCD75|nr:DUF63 family protein [Natrononativus amylolyticus]
MDEYIDRVGPMGAWAALTGIVALAITFAALAFPQRVYVDLIWQYYWGPVVADARGLGCVAWAGGAEIPCADAGAGDGPTASPGYTFVSYAGYIPILILLLVGIILLIRRLDIQRYRAGFYALFPFMLFGGTLRVVEDANVAGARETGEMVMQLPYVAALISPFIYVTVFLVTLLALLLSVWLERNGYVSGYEYPLAGIGTAALAVTVGYLGYLAVTEPFAEFHWLILVLTLVGATAVTAITWYALQAFAPEINRGTEYMGLVVIWAHAVDGVANVIGLDWAYRLGPGYNLTPKHPINEAIVNYTGSILPASIAEVTGVAWPFLIVKIVAAVVVIWIFDETVFDESPRYATLLMITVVAVGLGPGTRDMLRAVFGV